MLKFLSRQIVATRAGRYWLSKLSNNLDFDPLYDIMANRVPVGLRRLRQLGFAPDLVVDAGAYRGEWTTMALPVFPEARFVMLEAQPDKAAALEAVQAAAPGRVSFQIGLLGAERREKVPFFVAETGSSVYVETTAFARSEISLPMQTLDEALAAERAARSVFLKLDVQGAELDVLAGAAATLERTEAVLLEASLAEYNAGAPRLADVTEQLRKLGFLPFDILDLRRIGPVLAQIDMVFVRPESALARRAAEVIAGYGREQAGK
ncbi:FkbM family methyltransferase [Siccirubricoccus sp. G192]|uniref:FkbM family methyltransferase n=1 Tax=Siccirubricoccus sp. G192 TaxID=2849651 RepID=UPI001C2C5B32|nr:FkbM family methyltransferase [Siccirubricoccus sp. G192]MBV1799991.1 FkbM family methyltransferase [Siccirubricoccus sp. G192]